MEFTDSMNPELLERTLRSFVTPEGRAIGTQGNKRARRFIIDRLKKDEIGPYSDGGYCYPYGNSFIKGAESVNIVARIPGSKTNERPILIGAHYDTCGPNPGADDNAAAVAILLHISPLVTRLNLKRDVIVAFFDAEEPPSFGNPSMGSVRFYEDHLENTKDSDSACIPACAVIMDLVGHDIPITGMEDALAVTGFDSSAVLTEIETCDLRSEGVTVLKTVDLGLDLSDHIIFKEKGVPFLFLTCGVGPYYHTSQDTVETLNFTKIAGTGSVLLKMLDELDRVDFRTPGNRKPPLGSGSTRKLEIDQMNGLLEKIGPIPGYPAPISTEEDLEAIYEFLKDRLSI